MLQREGFRAVACASVAALLVVGVSTATRAQEPAEYLAGAAMRSIEPSAALIAAREISLGGAGSGRVMTATAAPGLHVRAVAVSTSLDPTDAMVLAVIETAGYFVSYEQCACGIVHIRRAASEATGIPVDRIVVTSNHSHSGPDTIGVWSSWPPAEYLEFIDAQSVAAIEEAVNALRPAQIRAGEAYAPELVSNDYAGAIGNDISDPNLRVIQAVDRGSGEAIWSLVNLSAHPIMWIDNSLGHGDWPAAIGDVMAQRYGGIGVGVVGAVGRMAPDRSWTVSSCKSQCRLYQYVNQLMLPRAIESLDRSFWLTDNPVVQSKSYLVLDPIVNPVPLALFALPDIGQFSIQRRDRTPWLTGNVLGTVAFASRIGEVAFDGGPGEMFPSMPATLRAIVPARMHVPVGLAGDMLGYIVYPAPDAYPEVVRRVPFGGDPNDPTDWNIAGGDDKFIFNMSPTFGERLVCAMLRGHGEILGEGLRFWDDRTMCASFVSDLAFASGDDARQVEL